MFFDEWWRHVLVHLKKYNPIKNNAIFVSTFYVKEKQYFNNTDVKNVKDNKKFWKTIRPKFPNKCKAANTVILV